MNNTILKNVFYINLLHRTDRKEKVENHLNKLNWKYERFNAICLPKKKHSGRIGCSMSHLKVLQKAYDNNLEYVVILEDDIEIENHCLFNKNVSSILNSSHNFDVLLFAGNCSGKQQKINNNMVKVSHCQTTTGYLVKCHYYPTLINNIKEGIQMLIKEPDNHYYYAIDKYWLKLQKQHEWILLYPILAYQRDDYSDIEGRCVNYSNIMKNVNII